jgi:hypothetical protein
VILHNIVRIGQHEHSILCTSTSNSICILSKRVFLDKMNLMAPWTELVALITPHSPVAGAKGGRPPFAVQTMLRIHFLQQWFGLRACENSLFMPMV